MTFFIRTFLPLFDVPKNWDVIYKSIFVNFVWYSKNGAQNGMFENFIERSSENVEIILIVLKTVDKRLSSISIEPPQRSACG